MVTKVQEDLKRPDLKGEFTCGSCRKIFLHAASLNRHRRTTHNDEYTCLICNIQLEPSEDIHNHMNWRHEKKVFTCGCCNYAFDNKKALYEHTKSIKETGQPGEFQPIAKSSHPPGSLLIHRNLSAAPYILPLQKRGGSLSPASSSAATSPTNSTSSSQNVSPTPVKQKKLAHVEHIASCEKLLNDAVSKILDDKIFSGSELTLPKTWEKIIELGRQMVIEDLEKQIATSSNPAIVV